MLRGAEEGVHRPVAVGRDQDHRARGRRADVGGRRDELDARGGEVVAIEFAELVGRDLADEAGAAAERRDARRGVARRSAADLVRRAHVRIEPLGLLGVDQPHRALDQPFARRGSRRSALAITSTMALPMHRTSRRGSGIQDSGAAIGKRAPSGAFSDAATLPRRAAPRHRRAHAPLSRPRLDSAPRRLRHRAAPASRRSAAACPAPQPAGAERRLSG